MHLCTFTDFPSLEINKEGWETFPSFKRGRKPFFLGRRQGLPTEKERSFSSGRKDTCYPVKKGKGTLTAACFLLLKTV